MLGTQSFVYSIIPQQGMMIDTISPGDVIEIFFSGIICGAETDPPPVPAA
jgi:hypothetical protein